MKILFGGDVVGRSGRDAVLKYVPELRAKHKLDAVIISGDNAAAGFGITGDIVKEFLAAGVDVITGGDHVWDQKDMPAFIGSEPRILRPHNFPPSVPGSGVFSWKTTNGKTIVVLHLLGQVFHKEYLDSPFTCADEALKRYTLGGTAHAIIVDMHAEATSEKMAMGRYLDGRVSMVVGSHTHVPTADARILQGGTAYQTDAGMCGDYESVIGFEQTVPLQSFLTKMRKSRMEAASGEATFCGTLVTVDERTGLATAIESIRLGGVLGA